MEPAEINKHKTPTLDIEDRESSEGEKAETPPPGSSPQQIRYRSGLERYINLASVVNFAIIILASWESFAVTFQFSLVNGGPASILYGSFFVGVGCCLVGFSLAELASIDPTVGAQYRWSANLAPSAPRFWGLLQGWITLGAWCITCAAPPSIIANLITAMAAFNNPTYVAQRWHTSLIMIASLFVPLAFNLWFRKLLNTFEMTGGILHLCLFVVFMVVLIVFGPRNSNEYVFKTLTWELSGWNNKGVSWGLGLLGLTFSTSGADSILHMCDEVKKVRTRVPRAIVVTCVGNATMLIAFCIVLLMYMGPLDDATALAQLPILVILDRITGSAVCANILVSCIAVINFLCLFNYFASVSRLVWVFARDNGLPFSPFFAYVHPTLKLPVNALGLVGTIVACLSLIYIASATAFNALISLPALALSASYFLPILFMLLRKIRGPPPPYGPWRIGKLGIPVNIGALVYLLFIMSWMPLPSFLPVTKDNMNYAGPIFAAVVIGGLVHWFVRGKNTFKLPVARYE